MPRKFEGRVALVTGGNAGIGRAAAIAFAREGANVVISARRVAEGEETIRLIVRVGGEGLFVKADVGVPADIKMLVEKTIAKFGRLDFAFNNAGVEGTSLVPTSDYAEETWHDVIRINLTGMFLCMKYEIPHLLKQKGSAIVNMSSVAGLVATVMGAGYHASKFGVIGLTKGAAVEYAKQGLRINAVCPAVIRTDMTERMFFQDPAIAAQITALHPLGRVGTVDEVAGVVIWLCSEEAGFITGQAIPIDGGLSAQ